MSFNKNEFITELRHKLRQLPNEDIENAVEYYEEYLNDASEEEIAALGTPSAVAAKIIGEYAIVKAQVNPKSDKQKNTMHPLLIAVLALFAAPIAFPVAISIIAVAFSVGVTLLSLVMSFVAVALSGIVMTVLGIAAFSYGVATGLFVTGVGLLTLALGATMMILAIKLTTLTFCSLQKWIGKLLIRRAKA